MEMKVKAPEVRIDNRYAALAVEEMSGSEVAMLGFSWLEEDLM